MWSNFRCRPIFFGNVRRLQLRMPRKPIQKYACIFLNQLTIDPEEIIFSFTIKYEEEQRKKMSLYGQFADMTKLYFHN